MSLEEHESLFSLVASKFKLSSLNVHQKRAISEVSKRGKDVFVNLPTDYGKSLIYQALPTVFDALRSSSGHIVVVVSPLVSLMDDQVKFLTSVGIKALNLTSASVEERINAEKGKYLWSMDRLKLGSKTSTGDQCCTTMCTPVGSVPLQSMRHMF